MNINEKEVLLLKSQSDGDKFGTLLTKNGYTVKHLAVLEFVFVNISELAKKLAKSEDYSGLIFTSPRSVTATKICLNGQLIDAAWTNKSNFVVGETTYSMVLKDLGLICKGHDSGNANNLSDLIIKEKYTKPFLFPCGNLKKETLQHRLKEHSIELDAITVYETRKSHSLEEDFYNVTSNCTNVSKYILFFSPSGVNFTAELIRKLPLTKLKLIAIGPSTEKAMNEENFPIFSVAKKPTEEEVFNTINQVTS